MKRIIMSVLAIFVLAARGTAGELRMNLDWNSLVSVEKAFCKASVEKGTRDAFLEFLADDGIIFRPNPVNGKEYLRGRPSTPGMLVWKPDWVDVSDSGDMGYTYGPWTFRTTGTDAAPAACGNYATIWKKQYKGDWKVVLDIGTTDTCPDVHLPEVEMDGTLTFQKFREPVKTVWKTNAETARALLLKLDGAFSDSSAARGVAKPFLSRFADDAECLRDGNERWRGRESIAKALSTLRGIPRWQPAAADISASGDLGYTYGISWTENDDKGSKKENYSNYVRIWLLQPDGNFKVVLDVASPCPSPEKSAND